MALRIPLLALQHNPFAALCLSHLQESSVSACLRALPTGGHDAGFKHSCRRCCLHRWCTLTCVAASVTWMLPRSGTAAEGPADSAAWHAACHLSPKNSGTYSANQSISLPIFVVACGQCLAAHTLSNQTSSCCCCIADDLCCIIWPRPQLRLRPPDISFSTLEINQSGQAHSLPQLVTLHPGRALRGT